MRNYKRKTERQSWSDTVMQEAVSNVLNGSMGYLKAARTFGVPQTTLERKVKLQEQHWCDAKFFEGGFGQQKNCVHF